MTLVVSKHGWALVPESQAHQVKVMKRGTFRNCTHIVAETSARQYGQDPLVRTDLIFVVALIIVNLTFSRHRDLLTLTSDQPSGHTLLILEFVCEVSKLVGIFLMCLLLKRLR